MELTEIKKNERLHEKGQQVSTLELLVSGTMKITSGKAELLVKQGSILGLTETPDEPYFFTYTAAEDCKVVSYPYESADDIRKLVLGNAKIAPILAQQAIRTANDTYEIYEHFRSAAENLYHQTMSDYSDYPDMAGLLGETVYTFSSLEQLEEPPEPKHLQAWMPDFLSDLREHEDLYMKQVFSKSPVSVYGHVMGCALFVQFLKQEIAVLQKYRKAISEETKDFYYIFNALKEKTDVSRRVDEIAVDGEETPDFSDALDVILSYAGMPEEPADNFRALLENYKSYEDRSDTTDTLRKIRRGIGDAFFKIYEHVFLRMLEHPDNVPPAVDMFLMFGFVDEELAGAENTQILYQILKTHESDPSGVVVTIPEWLYLIYKGKVMPSKNEFDLDYPAYLREQRQNGEITEEREKERLNNMKERVKFEIENLFKTGDRMTFGRASVFVPVFDAVNVLKPLDRAYLQSGILHKEIDEIRRIDYGCFYKSRSYANPDIDITSLPVAKEVLPYLILMPNVGSRIALWQEIEGKKRDTPARFILPMFTAEDPMKAFVAACGEYRWEMIKTEQGVHWNDITDPSLTAEYADYIQYYRKNRDLSAEQREKLKKQIAKVGGNLRRVFVADYLLYILSESAGSPVLNKVSRRILFTYLPFSKDIREKIGGNPQYAELMNRFNKQIGEKKRPLETAIRRLEQKGMAVPRELLDMRRYLEM